jgi:hypothetical protein
MRANLLSQTAVTKYFKYTVGDACESAVVSTALLPLDFESSTIHTPLLILTEEW